jgi:hypothetical protein
MPWDVEYTDEFGDWWAKLPTDCTTSTWYNFDVKEQ